MLNKFRDPISGLTHLAAAVCAVCGVWSKFGVMLPTKYFKNGAGNEITSLFKHQETLLQEALCSINSVTRSVD